LDKGGVEVSEKSRWVDWETDRVAAHFEVDPAVGLDPREAERRLKTVGPNRLSEGEKTSPFIVFLNQFKDFMVLVLLVATLISGLLGEYLDAVAIIAIVFLNAILGFVQEVRAERSLSALKELSAPMARVLRGGTWERIPAADLVPGDIVSLESGDRIPADVRLIRAESLFWWRGRGASGCCFPRGRRMCCWSGAPTFSGTGR
jgi:Ca2+-transporting ATPase